MNINEIYIGQPVRILKFWEGNEGTITKIYNENMVKVKVTKTSNNGEIQPGMSGGFNPKCLEPIGLPGELESLLNSLLSCFSEEDIDILEKVLPKLRGLIKETLKMKHRRKLQRQIHSLRKELSKLESELAEC